MSQSRVRFIGIRELHRDLPKVLESLENSENRCVLTIHNKPKAVLIGAEAFLELLREHSVSDRLLALQLGALGRGLNGPETEDGEAEPESIEVAAVSETETEVSDDQHRHHGQDHPEQPRSNAEDRPEAVAEVLVSTP